MKDFAYLGAIGPYPVDMYMRDLTYILCVGFGIIYPVDMGIAGWLLYPDNITFGFGAIASGYGPSGNVLYIISVGFGSIASGHNPSGTVLYIISVGLVP